MIISLGNSNEIVIQIKVRFLIYLLHVDEKCQVKQLPIYIVYSLDHNHLVVFGAKTQYYYPLMR